MNNIDEYVKDYPEHTRHALEEIRKLIKKLSPQAEETISYNMPCFKLNNDFVAYYAAWKKHIGFYGTSDSTISALKDELSQYVTPKGTLQFPLDEPMPLSLIEKLIKFRIKEILESKVSTY